MAISPVSGSTPQIQPQTLNQNPEVNRQDIESAENRRDIESPERNTGNPQAQLNLQSDRTNQANAGADSQNNTANQTENLLRDIAQSNRAQANQPQPSQNQLQSPDQENATEDTSETRGSENTETSSAINPSSTRAQTEDLNAQRLQDALQAPRLGQGIDLNA